LSSGVKIYSASDDYLGRSMTNPTVPEKYKKVKIGKVILEKHVIIGSSSVILPNVTIGEGASVGALSLVKDNLEEWSVYAGSPVKKLGKRLKKPLELEKLFLEENELEEYETDLINWRKNYG
jgi:acetyltransferase-like isoleucine patch superfamily enzyme